MEFVTSAIGFVLGAVVGAVLGFLIVFFWLKAKIERKAAQATQTAVDFAVDQIKANITVDSVRRANDKMMQMARSITSKKEVPDGSQAS